MPVRIGPVPLPWIPEGRTRGRRTPSGGGQRSRPSSGCSGGPSGQDVGLSNRRSAFESRPERADRWQKSPCTPPQRETMQVQVLPDPSPRWLKVWERPSRKREVCRCKSGPRPRTRSSIGQSPSLLRIETRVRIPSRPPCPRGLQERTAAREATGGGSIPLGGVGHVV